MQKAGQRRLALRVSKARARTRATFIPWWRVAEHVIGVCAGLAAIAGFGIWIAETRDRDEERSVRRAELLERAQAAIVEAANDDTLDVTRDPRLAWAITTLVSLDIPVRLNAKTVNLRSLDVDCADISIRGETVFWHGSMIRGSKVEVWTPYFSLDSSIALDTKFNVLNNYDPDPDPMTLVLAYATLDRVEFNGLPILSAKDGLKIRSGTIRARDLLVVRGNLKFWYPSINSDEGSIWFQAGPDCGSMPLDEAGHEPAMCKTLGPAFPSGDLLEERTKAPFDRLNPVQCSNAI